jgi:hypothetical protein
MNDQLVALVTGAGSGIGAQVCRLLVEDGMRVTAADRNEAGLHQTAALVSRSDRLQTTVCDICDDDAVRAMVADTVAWGSRLDVVVNAAGVLARYGTAETTDEVWTRVIDINLSGTFRVVRAAREALMDPATAGTKRVINVGSGAADQGYLYPAYTASKGGGGISDPGPRRGVRTSRGDCQRRKPRLHTDGDERRLLVGRCHPRPLGTAHPSGSHGTSRRSGGDDCFLGLASLFVHDWPGRAGRRRQWRYFGRPTRIVAGRWLELTTGKRVSSPRRVRLLAAAHMVMERPTPRSDPLSGPLGTSVSKGRLLRHKLTVCPFFSFARQSRSWCPRAGHNSAYLLMTSLQSSSWLTASM